MLIVYVIALRRSAKRRNSCGSRAAHENDLHSSEAGRNESANVLLTASRRGTYAAVAANTSFGVALATNCNTTAKIVVNASTRPNLAGAGRT